MVDAYRVLNVSPNATDREIRDSYLEMACQYHPCKLSDRQVLNPNLISTNSNHTQFRLAAEAFTLIGDDLRRKLYDLVKSPSNLSNTNSAGRYGLDDLPHSALPEYQTRKPIIGRSRARSELTVDLRQGLPSEMRAWLIDLDPIKVFNRVASQHDQLLRHQKPTVSSQAAQPKYLSPPSHHSLDHDYIASHSISAPQSSPNRQDSSINQYLSPNGPLKAGILRDESRSQFRKPANNLSEWLSQEATQSDRYSSSRDSARSRGHSTTSSYISSSPSLSADNGSNKYNKSRRVSFSNDVIESDELKQAREAVLSYKREAARQASTKSTLTRSSPLPSVDHLNKYSSSSRAAAVSNNKLATLAHQSTTSPPSTFKKPNEFFLDKSLYSDHDCSSLNAFPQDILIKPIGLGLATCSSTRSQAGGSYRHYDEDNSGFLANSAPTGFLARHRFEHDYDTIDRNVATRGYKESY